MKGEVEVSNFPKFEGVKIDSNELGAFEHG